MSRTKERLKKRSDSHVLKGSGVRLDELVPRRGKGRGKRRREGKEVQALHCLFQLENFFRLDVQDSAVWKEREGKRDRRRGKEGGGTTQALHRPVHTLETAEICRLDS